MIQKLKENVEGMYLLCITTDSGRASTHHLALTNLKRTYVSSELLKDLSVQN